MTKIQRGKNATAYRAWAIYERRGPVSSFMTDTNYKRLKRNWDGWFKWDGRWIFSEIIILPVGKILQPKKRKS